MDRLLASPVKVTFPTKESPMHLTAAHFSPLVALIAGILILIVPRLLNYIVAIYLILVGLVGLNGIYHLVH
jgi:cobalamin synthase